MLPKQARYLPGYMDDGAAEWPTFLAEDVARVDARFAVIRDGKPYSTKYEQFTVLEAAAINELAHKVSTLEAELMQLRRRVH